MRPTIAVITPAHPARLVNGMLTRAMDSVYRQTLLPDEIHVAVDNNQEGAAPTRQRALKRAGTDWVAFLDSDDILMPQHLEHLLEHALDTGADYVYSWFKLVQIRADGIAHIHETDPIFPSTHFSEPFNPDEPIETTITTLVRRELAQEVGFFKLERGEVNSGEDRRFTLECIKKGAVISHLVEHSWYWCHWQMPNGLPGNSSGLPTRGDAAA